MPPESEAGVPARRDENGKPNVNAFATAETRRRGALASAAKRRELAMSARERLARKLDEHFEELVQAAVNQAIGGEWRAFVSLFEAAHGRPPQAIVGDADKPLKVVVASTFASQGELEALDLESDLELPAGEVEEELL
jgi:hypothetical protein